MKSHFRLIGTGAMALLAMATLLNISGCDGNEPTQAEKVTDMLTANGSSWSAAGNSSVKIDGVDVGTELFADFSITFGDGTLTTTGTTPVWLRQDTWTFKDKSATVMIRGQDNKEVTISSINKTDLTLTLSWEETTYEGGRKRSLAGVHTFILHK